MVRHSRATVAMSARILLIEDNTVNMEMMVYLLKAFQYVPLLAYNGKDGLEIAKRELPDLILCDIRLPGWDGYDVVRRLKEDPSLSETPVLAITVVGGVNHQEQLLAAGFDGYVDKPIEPESFVAQIEKLAPSIVDR